jgi:Ca2+-binding EF-hand superfamily protein
MADDLTDSQKKEYKVAFDKYADGDKLRAKKLSVVRIFFLIQGNFISYIKLFRTSLTQAIRELGFSIKGDELQDYFKVVNVEISGSLDLNQYYQVMAEKLKRADNPDDIIAAFKGFDPDKDFMEEKRFKLIMQKMGAKLNDEEISELLKEVSKDGKVYFDKLKDVVLG